MSGHAPGPWRATPKPSAHYLEALIRRKEAAHDAQARGADVSEQLRRLNRLINAALSQQTRGIRPAAFMEHE